jgi:signal transduction histidine kinase
MKRLSLLLLGILLPGHWFAQTPQIDSLKQLLKTQEKDTNRVNTLNELSNKLMRVGMFDTALVCASEARALASSLDFKNGAARSHIHSGNIYFCQGNFSEALENYKSSLNIKRELGDRKGMAAAYMGIGNVYFSQGNYPEALKGQLSALQIKEELKDTKGIADSYVNIGNIYYREAKYPEALKSYSDGLKTMEKTGNKKNIADCYNNIGNVYWSQGKFAEAIKNHEASLLIEQEIGDKQGIARSYNNLGAVYDAQKDYTKALSNYFEGLKIREELGDREGIENSSVNIGATYTKKGDYANAEMYGKKALALAREVGDLQVVKSAYENLAEAYRLTNRPALALESYKHFIAVRDSLLNEENTRKMVRTEMNYEFDKKEAALKAEQEKKESIRQEELKRQKQINWFVAGAMLLLLLLVILLFNRYQLAQKNKFQQQINRQQKEQAVAVMETQEEERKRIAEDLHDSLGHLLSAVKLNLQTLPAQEKQVGNSLQLLDQASEEIRNITFNLMPRTLEEEGLISALRELAAKVTGSGSVTINLHIHGMEKFILEKQSQFNIYRIVQEAVNNILKHANAKEINIQVLGQADHITIMIEDDGKGFDPSNNKEGRGLKNIVTRSVWLKGSINIDSTPGKGTTITTEIPV